MLFCSDETHPDTVVICPYDANHKISRARLQRHLVKCERNFPEGYMEICPYNATHRFFKAEMKDHILSCPMKRFLEPSQFQNPTVRSNGCVSLRQVSECTSMIDFSEDWSDDESDTQSKKREPIPIPARIVPYNAKESDDESEMDDYTKPLRRPYGFSQMMMMEVNSSVEDDMSSIKSFMGMGRGRGITLPSHRHLLKKISLGRGKGAISSSDQ